VIGASPFEIRSEPEAGGVRLRLSGELDIATAARLQDAVAAAREQGASRVLLDMGGLSFVDSSGLRMCILLSARAAEEGWTLELTRPPEPPLSVFRMTGAEENLPFIEESERS
jgi:anti-sigma B factor antagonist